MISVLREFENAISEVQNLNAIHDHLLNDLHLNVAASEILRCQLVYTVSAMDRYFHEIVRVGFLEEYKGVHENGKWKYYSVRCKECKNVFKTYFYDRARNCCPICFPKTSSQKSIQLSATILISIPFLHFIFIVHKFWNLQLSCLIIYIPNMKIFTICSFFNINLILHYMN